MKNKPFTRVHWIAYLIGFMSGLAIALDFWWWAASTFALACLYGWAVVGLDNHIAKREDKR